MIVCRLVPYSLARSDTLVAAQALDSGLGALQVWLIALRLSDRRLSCVCAFYIGTILFLKLNAGQ